MKRLLSLLLAFALIVVLAVPVLAAEDSCWTELLESTSVNSNGTNTFTVSGTSGYLTIPLYTSTRLRRIDLLIWNPTGQRFTAATVTASGSTTNLDIYAIGGNLTRVVGYVPSSTYSSITVKLTKSTSTVQTYEVLSCKVSSLGVQEFVCDADVYLDGAFYDTGSFIITNGVSNAIGTAVHQYRVNVYDWEKYDQLSIWGSMQNMALNSIRASIGTAGLPITVSYMDNVDTGQWIMTQGSTDGYYGDGQYGEGIYEYSESSIIPVGKILFCITIDLSNVDRTLGSEPMYIYFTCPYNVELTNQFNCQYVNGSVVTADTTQITWWNRFTSFMNGLFGSNSSGALDDLGGSSDSITQDAADIHEFEQSQQAVLDSNFSSIQTAVTFTNFSAALSFVQRYSNMAFAGISDYSIVLTLPLFLGLFFYLCSRIPGVTRWKSRPPKSKGGDDP